MCGILGQFSIGGEARSLALGALRHRGPDAEGEWRSRDGRCWLGHTRLSILELSAAGAQPMSSASGSSVAVFNGEIYNHSELRSRLPGFAWRGHSDTETLVELWEREGEGCLSVLRGMFAFAVYDARSARLDLVRDRLGIKPVYFRVERDNGVSFSSELRALGDGRGPQLCGSALATYLATGHMPAIGEIGSGIQILPPGSHLRIDAKGNREVRRWWSVGKKSDGFVPGNPDGARRAVRALVESSVGEHLLSDVPVACFLSGGIDSSIVALAAAKGHGRAPSTFCIGFPNVGLDERKLARLVAERAGSQHVEIEAGPDECLAWVIEAVEALDSPSADAINTYIVSKAVRLAGFKVALSGLGGDEIFGGYASFVDIPRLEFLGRVPSWMARGIVHAMPRSAREKLEDARAFDPFTLALLRRRWWSDRALTDSGAAGDVVWPPTPGFSGDSFESISQAEILGYMEPMLLRDSDQMGMAVGLELRVPLLDHRLVEAVSGFPAAWKQGTPAKRLLIEAFADILPRECWDRPKQGFVLPMEDWMRGPLADFCREGLDAVKSRLKAGFVDAAVAQFEARRIHWTRVWQLVVLGHYLEKNR
jgi:asparagine synthase (glutamine-hydrolysing)